MVYDSEGILQHYITKRQVPGTQTFTTLAKPHAFHPSNTK